MINILAQESQSRLLEAASLITPHCRTPAQSTPDSPQAFAPLPQVSSRAGFCLAHGVLLVPRHMASTTLQPTGIACSVYIICLPSCTLCSFQRASRINLIFRLSPSQCPSSWCNHLAACKVPLLNFAVRCQATLVFQAFGPTRRSSSLPSLPRRSWSLPQKRHQLTIE